MDNENTQRAWTHEEIGEEASRLIRAEDLLGRTVEDLRDLPSLRGDLAGDFSDLRVVLQKLEAALVFVREQADRAAESAASSYMDECKRHNQAIWAEWEARREEEDARIEGQGWGQP